ncbi:flippase [Pleurocapsa sp. FMAR1]|uniref:flippase n=1 Tax=Pleurocapsa sp. FMAR1 TaxID=3040204 RepID=UPI0029C92934|nr:flippase [Pleurocapsa sp. FMAR1]
MLNKFKLLDEKLSPGLKKIISSIGWLTAERVFMMGISFFVGINVIRYLGPGNYGKLSYSISFAGLIGVIAKLGLDQIVVRNLVKDEESTQEILGTAFLLKLIGSLFTVALIGIGIWIFSNDSQIRWMTVIVGIGLVFTAFEIIDFWFQSKVLSKPMAVVRSGQLILTSAAKLVLIFGKFPLMAFAWVFLAEFVLKAIGMIWIYNQSRQSILRWQISWSKATELMKDSWPLILSGVMILIYMKIDQVMLGNMAGNKAVGNYAAAVKLSEPCYFVPGAICSSIFPALIQAKLRNQQEYQNKIQQLYDLMAWLALAIAIPITFVSDILATTLLGQEYAEVGTILRLHIWASPFVFLGVAQSKWLMAENFTRFSMMATSLGALSNIILNFLLIPQYEGVGAAIATVTSYAIATYLSCIFYPPVYKNAWMLTKALFIPLRWRQNLIYLRNIRKVFS